VAGGSEPNIVCHWKLDEPNGTVAYDSIGGHNGVVYGATWISEGQVNRALDFDGYGDYVDVGDIGITGDWTVCFWAKSNDNAAIIYYPIGFGSPYISGVIMGGIHPIVRQHIAIYDATIY